MDVTISELLKRFVHSPLVTWVKTFGPVGESNNSEDSLTMYMDLVDGVFLNKIMLQIDPRPTSQRVNKNIKNDVNLRIQNLTILVKHIKSYYQENLQQLIIMNLPDVLMIGRDPLSDKSMEEMNKLLLLMLGCAVQCSRKEEFIERIKQLDIETQASIVMHIQRVTHDQENVFDLQLLEHPDMTLDELEALSRSMAVHLKRLIDERDEFCEVIVDLTQERDYLQSQSPPSPVKSSSPEKTLNTTLPLSKEDKQHLGVELADTKAKLRRIRQELEEKSEQLIDVRHELDQLQAELQKLKQENMQLSADARLVRAYRDELDSLREKASRVDKLETELVRCKEKLHDVDFYKARMEELREDNIILIETKAMLEEQLSGARSRSDKLHELEKENLQLKSKLHDFEIDRDADKKRIEELLEENMVLEIAQKQSMNESAQLGWELEQLSKSTDLSDVRKSFVFEMNESASSRILKLEKENQSLQSTIQGLRDVSLTMEENNLRVQELEKENQQLHQQIEVVQFQLEQEKQTCQDMEMLSEELLKDKEQLKEIIENIRAEKERQIKELELENNHLNQTVTSLRQRSQISTEAKIKDIEKENRALHETVKETSSKLSKVEFDKKHMQKELVQLTEKLEKAEEQEKVVHELERENEMLHKKVATLSIVCEKVEVVEQENSTLELEYRRLKKAFDSLQNATIKLEALEKDNKQLDEENLELRKMVETLKFASKKMAQVELENKELEQEKEELRKEVEELRARSKKYERLELSYHGMELDNQRLQQTVENCSRKMQQLEKETQETKAERQTLQQKLNELLISSSRADTLEKENRVLQQEVAHLEKDKKSLEKETKRLWQQVESKDAVLDENSVKLDALEKENKTLEKETLRFRESYNKVKELEKDNKELMQKMAVDEQMLTELREELVLEKLKIQQMYSDREKVSLELEKIGLNVELLLQDEQNCDEKKYRVLETKNEVVLKQKLEDKEEQISELEIQVQEYLSTNQQLRKELDVMKSDFEAVKQRQAEERSLQNSSMNSIEKLQPVQQMKEKWELEHRETTMELLKVKDRVIDVERNNAALQTEKQLLKDQLRQLENQNSSLNNQILALQTQASSLHEHSSALQTQTAKLQVENSTLSSQSASLLAQNALLQRQQVTMENEMDVWLKKNEEMRTTHDLLLQDHERLVTLHEHQSTEYEALISQYSTLKTFHRSMELERKELEQRFEHLKMEKVEWEAMGKVLKAEQEKMHIEKQKSTLLLSENKKIQEELDRANVRQNQMKEEYDELQIHTKDLKTSLNNVQLELSRWQARYDELKDQHQNMDITLTKLGNHCELLTRLKGNLEEENHHLMSQMQMLNQQNHALLEQTMESKELYHEEQKQYIDKLNALRRQKEKLEEKIMDQYKFYDPVPKKKNHWVGARALAKLIKPKKDSNKERSKSTSDVQPLQPEMVDIAAAPSTSAAAAATVVVSAAQSAPASYPPKPQHEGVDNSSAVQNLAEENHTASVSKAMNDFGHRQRELSRSTGNNECVELPDDAPLRHRLIERTSKAYSTSNIHLSASVPTPNSAIRQQNRPKGFKSNDDLLEQSYDTDFPDSGHLVPGIRPNSTENSRTTSNNSSPLSPKGSSDHIPGRSESLSSDDLVPSRDMAVVSKDGYLYRSSSAYVIAASSGRLAQSQSQNGFVPYDPPQKSAPVPHWTQKQARASSPGSEMVTLQEFLEESNRLSPPGEKLNPRDELLGDYFRKVNDPPAIGNQPVQSVRRENPKMTANFVSPAVKASLDSTEERAANSGQYVSPSSRRTEIPCHQNLGSSGRPALTQQNRPLSAFSTTKKMQQMQPPSNVGSRGTSLNRAFSLASADLLRANGPDDHMQEVPQKPSADTSVGKGLRDPSWRPSPSSGIPVTMRERPQSARVSGTSVQGTDHHSRTWDPRRFSHTASQEERKLPLQQHSVSSFALNSSDPPQQDRLGPTSGQQHYSSTQLPVSRIKMRPPSRSGEVAMVAPVRAIPNYSGEEGAPMQSINDAQISKNQTRPAESSTAAPGKEDISQSSPSAAKSTSESPDSSTEQQTVWYEYGCV